jgi:hypothetical protein|tara:strand:- start:466 stop:879 length:414 start_codon:yes stop_codon:yes gene_type:complete
MAGQYGGGSTGGRTDFFTNLPAQNQDELEKTITDLTTNTYETNYEFNTGEYDAAIAFFVKRGFARTSAESTAYVILAQAKIDNISPQSILDKLSGVTDIQLSELITIILNANRYKSSRLGVRQTLTTKETVSRNIID